MPSDRKITFASISRLCFLLYISNRYLFCDPHCCRHTLSAVSLVGLFIYFVIGLSLGVSLPSMVPVSLPVCSRMVSLKDFRIKFYGAVPSLKSWVHLYGLTRSCLLGQHDRSSQGQVQCNIHFLIIIYISWLCEEFDKTMYRDKHIIQLVFRANGWEQNKADINCAMT